jgi:hypothetical protein
MSWRIFTHHTLKTLLRIVQVFAFVIVPGVLLWLQFVGLPRTFFPPIIEAAQRAGLQLEFSRMRLSLLEGLVLDGVEMRAANLPENNEVKVDRVAVSLDWRRLARGAVDLTALDLRGAQLYLPVSTGDDVVRSVRLTRARARLMLADGVVSVPLARFNFQGIDVIASGQVALRGKTGEAPSSNLLPSEIAKAMEILEEIDFGTIAPVLELEFTTQSGNAAALQLPRIRLQAPRATYGNIRLRDIRLEATYARQVLDLSVLSARGENAGALTASGRWNLTTGEGRGDVRSSLDPVPWLEQLYPESPWAELAFNYPPIFEATVETGLGEPRHVKALGTLECGPFALHNTEFGGLSGGFSWRNGDFYASDVILQLPTGTIRSDLIIKPDDVRLRVHAQADPLPLAALLDEKVQTGLAKMELKFIEPPEIKFEAAGPKLDPNQLRAKGQLKLGKTSIHDSTLDNASAVLSFEGLALTLSKIDVKRPEGTGSGLFTYDFGRNQVRLEEVRSSMNPFNVLQWADPKVARETKPYRFKAPPEVKVSGVIGLKDPTLTKLRADFTAPQGLDYDLLERTLNFGTTTGSLEFNGRAIKVEIPSAKLFGGTTRLKADIATGQPNARQKMSVNLSKVNFETLTRLYFDYKDSKGVVSGNYDFSFVTGNARAMSGGGNLIVENGNVFAIPVLGPLSVVLDTIIPGTGYQTARKATCDFRVADGEIRTDNLDVIGQGFSMIGQGSLYFIEDRMDFSVRINAQGVPGLILYPVSKLFEYVSDGKLSEPQWRPRILPKSGSNNNGGKPSKPDSPPARQTSEGAGRNGRA